MKILRTGAAFAALFVLAFSFTGCKQKTSAISFIASLDFADSLIRNSQIPDALKVIKELAKSASTGMQFLSVVKRYFELADYEQAENLLQNALKVYPSDGEIRAVYARFLLSQGSFTRAVEVATPLAGTKYGSILTEAKIYNVKGREVFFSHDFIPHYIDAAHSTRDSAFLRNAAIIYAINGAVSQAAALQPKNLFYYEQPLFWAYIMYDASYFDSALHNLALIDNSLETAALKADIYMQAEQYPQAYAIWTSIIDTYPDFSPVVYANAALYAKQNSRPFEVADFLLKLVTRYPDYVPGLIFYAQLALELSAPREDDALTAAVRRGGLLSLGMQAQAKLPRIPVEDAFKRIEESLARTKDSRLTAEYLKLQWQLEHKTAAARKIDLWLALERDSDNEYLQKYAVWFFMTIGDTTAAEQVFYNYMEQKYGTTDIISLVPLLDRYESECAAYLLTPDIEHPAHKSYQTSLLLYKNALAENPKSFTLTMNLANVLNSAGKTKDALDLYGKAASLALSDVRRAETHVRAAQIYAASESVRNAKISLQYALALHPENTKVRLLQRKLSQ